MIPQDWMDRGIPESDIEHYGRKGMKWYQSIYGSKDKVSRSGKPLTADQRRRAREKSKAAKQKDRAKKKSEAEEKRAERDKQKQAERREKILRNPTKLYKHRNDFSQDEINAALKRFAWEKQLSDYSMAQLERGQKYLTAAFDTMNASINIYNSAARIANGFNPNEKPWPYIPTAKTDKKEDQKK